MPVPMIDLRRQYEQIRPEVEAAVAEVFETQWFVGGPNLSGLEADMTQYVGVAHAVGVASGTDALLLLLQALEMPSGSEVITTAFSFFATAGAIANAGVKPVFADVDPDTLNIDPAQVEACITENTRAIIAVNLYGQCADLDPLMDLANKHGLHLFEDAAQSLGARYKDRSSCSIGHAAAISFYPTKNLGAAGDAGMVVTNDAQLAQRVALLRAHGADDTYHHRIVGANSRLDALQAAVLRVKFPYLDQWNEARRERAAYYDDAFADMPEVRPVACAECNQHVYHQYVVRLPRRDDARQFLSERGIGCAVFYPIPLHCQECFEHLGYTGRDCPNAVRAAKEVLALPMFPELTQSEQDEVIVAIRDHVASV
ncbi:MAG: aminotransferase class I/II-fold pyridoxal phosphate-dependent enzyme [Nitrospiraceae bacterium]|nr:aminotransferase class I/II-fold pyridoxal phosphate-dependent enzyme [Nitrospiraceae bacterium]